MTAATDAGLNIGELQNVRSTGGKTIARCPACAESGHDKAGNHLFIDTAGKFGCVSNPGPGGAEHRKRIFALAGVPGNGNGRKPITPPPAPPKTAATATKAGRVYPTLDDAAAAALRAVEHTTGTPHKQTRCDEYQNAAGAGVAAVLRFDSDTGKSYRPVSTVAGGWRLGDPDGLWPLFGLPELLKTTGAVYICEGEKAAVSGLTIGLPCVAAAHGAQSPHKSDWAPLKGRPVVKLPDNDDPGRAYAEKVAQLVTTAGAASVRILALPGLPEKGDLFEFIAARPDVDAADIVAEIQALADACEAWAPPAPVAASGNVAATDIRAALWSISQEKMPATEAHRKAAGAVVAWLHNRGRFYFHEGRRDFASVMFFDATRKLLLPVQSDAFLAWLADAVSMNRAERAFAFIAAAVETEGLSERSTGIEPATFWAARPGAVYLSNGPGRMVKCTAAGVATVDNGTDGVLFPYGSTLEPWELCEPENPFEACALFRDMATQADHGRLLFALWATILPADLRTKPPLCTSGPIGSGKTRLIAGLFELFGLPARIGAITKNGDGDFWATLDGGGLVCWDNADTRVDWLPDALAAAATAGTLEKRRLYSDADRVSLRARAWVAVTSASPAFAADAGLADRLIVVRLNRRTGTTAETALGDEIRAQRNAGLSWICRTLADALGDSGPIPGGLNARHPDWAALAVRIGRAMNREAETVAALTAAERDKGLFNLENDSIGAALLELLSTGPFDGTAAELLEALKGVDSGLEGRLSCKGLGKRLLKLWPHLESTLNATKERDGHSKTWRFRFNPVAGFAVFETLFSGKSYAKEE